MHIQKEILINETKDKIKDILLDLRQMSIWSPWNIIEPEAIVKFNDKKSQVGSFQEWDGEIIGSGNVEIINIDDNNTIPH